MARSALATAYIPSPASNHYGQRKEKIKKTIVHHAAGVLSAKTLADLFANPKRKASANYVIGNDGEIICCLDESIVPGTSGSYDADKDAVTIEVSNCATHDNWPVSPKALNSLILLCADIAKRNDLGKLIKRENLCWHSMYAATACPGPFLLSKMDYIAAEANKINFKFDGEIAGNDIPRTTDSLVVYFKGLLKDGRTGTNQWGYEAPIDKNGVVLESPEYRGNTKIPEGGKVLSGHGKAGAWLQERISLGDLVWFENGKAQIIKGLHKTVDSVDGQRYKDYLCVYRNGKKCPTNEWGTEVAIDKNGVAGKPVYGVGKMEIPEGGFVVSGHGKASDWVLENIKKGRTVTFNGKILKVM